MPRKSKRQEAPPEELESRPTRRIRPSAGTIVRFALMTTGIVIAVFGAAWVLWQGEQFLAEDPRFRIAEFDRGAQDLAITVDGVRNASKDSVLRVFTQDRGRSLSKLDPEARRAALREVEWVKDATVRRIWPNRVAVSVEERVPVAFIQVPFRASGSMENPISYRPMLIDGEGVILRVRGEVPRDLPLLTGVLPGDSPVMRRDRVRLMRRILDELQEVRQSVTEIDVGNPEELAINYQMHDQMYTLILGSERFKERLERFVQVYPSNKDKIPHRAVVDLTHETRIVLRSVQTASSEGTGSSPTP